MSKKKLHQMIFSAEIQGRITFTQWSDHANNRVSTTTAAWKSNRCRPTHGQLLAESAICTLYNHVRKYTTISGERDRAILKRAIRTSNKEKMMDLLERRFEDFEFWFWKAPQTENIQRHWDKILRKELRNKDFLVFTMLNSLNREVILHKIYV